MQKLVRGIHRFQSNYFARNKELFEQLATCGQKPETLFITCSDSRVVPEYITSAAPGEMFIIRNIGNVVPRWGSTQAGGVVAAIQYAVEFLEVGDVIICGHTGCGAMQAILEPERLAKLDHVRMWLDQTKSIREIIDTRYAHLVGEARLTASVEENVLFQLDNLRHFPFVADRLEAGKLRLSGWVFKIATGEVFRYEPEREEFEVLLEER
ncbi:MAG TPA: carbonic anhydrase [Byssovorax sp.]|jgi:carbonic anhydrase